MAQSNATLARVFGWLSIAHAVAAFTMCWSDLAIGFGSAAFGLVLGFVSHRWNKKDSLNPEVSDDEVIGRQSLAPWIGMLANGLWLMCMIFQKLAVSFFRWEWDIQ